MSAPDPTPTASPTPPATALPPPADRPTAAAAAARPVAEPAEPILGASAAGEVAHRLNNLLTVILGNADLLLERLTEPEAVHLARQIADAASSGAALIAPWGRLLDAGPPAAAEPAPPPAAVSAAGSLPATPLPRPAEAPPGQGQRILLVEDDALVRLHVAGQLGALGYQVVRAENGEDALAILQGDELLDLVFTDVVMPGDIGGSEVAANAAALRPGLPVLFTSGYPREALARDGQLHPSIHFLAKPYRQHDLATAIHAVLSRQTASPPTADTA